MLVLDRAVADVRAPDGRKEGRKEGINEERKRYQMQERRFFKKNSEKIK